MAEVQPYPSPPSRSLSSIPPSETASHGANEHVNPTSAMSSNPTQAQPPYPSEEQEPATPEDSDTENAPTPPSEGQTAQEPEQPVEALGEALNAELTALSPPQSRSTDIPSPSTGSVPSNNLPVREEPTTNDAAPGASSEPQTAASAVVGSTEEMPSLPEAHVQSGTDRTAASQLTDADNTSNAPVGPESTPPVAPIIAENVIEPPLNPPEPDSAPSVDNEDVSEAPAASSEPAPPPPADTEDVPEPLRDASDSAPPPPAGAEDTPEPPRDASDSAPPPPPEETAYWVDLKEDTSSPDENELKEIEEGGNETSALDYKWHEDQFYSDLDDPEYRPSKKIRITWIIKGVRGTKERPNMARIMNSPSAEAGGYFWRLKFFPRGNNCRPLSCYIKCSKSKMEDDEEMPETKFSWIEGPGDELLSEGEKKGNLSFPATPPKVKKPEESSGNENADAERSELTNEAIEGRNQDQNSTDKESTVTNDQVPADDVNWRVPAQIAVVIYNPDEPRTNHHNSSCHQFNKGNDDWGWTNFMPEAWDEIHTRQKSQRRALLQGDTLAFDAYIRIFDDPTQRLWFHTSDQEGFWDGVGVTGYRAFGTPPLRYSPGVAGLSAILHLAPIRNLIQGINIDEWQKNPLARQKEVCTFTQGVLYLMRKLRKNVSYVDLYPLLNILGELGEKFYDALSFWERFRRSIEVDCGEESVSKGFSAVFDIQPKDPNVPIERDPLSVQQATLSISCKEVSSISQGVNKLEPSRFQDKILPPFLTVDLGRQKFNYDERAWKLHYNRVRLDEELDLSSLVPHQDRTRYTLYGFVVHSGERTSQHFYTVIRPNGPGTRWLAFEDGDGNKILIQTKKMLEEFEGLEGNKLQENSSTRHTAYLAMYIRTDLVPEYLPGKLETWEPSRRVKMHSSLKNSLNDDDLIEEEKPTESEISVSISFSKRIEGHKGFLNTDVLRNGNDSSIDTASFCVPATTSLFDLRKMAAESRKVENARKIRFWSLLDFPPLEDVSKCVHRITAYDDTIGKISTYGRANLWAHLLRDDEIESFGFPDPQPKPKKEKRKRHSENDVPTSRDESHENITNSNLESGASAAESSAPPGTSVESVVADSVTEPPLEPTTVTSEGQGEITPVQTSTDTRQEIEQTAPSPAVHTQQMPVDGSVAQPDDLQVQQDNATTLLVAGSQPISEIQRDSVAAIAPQNAAIVPNVPAAAEGDAQNTADSSNQETTNTAVSDENAEALLNDAVIAEILADDVAAFDAAEGQTVSAQAATDEPVPEPDVQAGGDAENPSSVPPTESQAGTAEAPPGNEENNDDAASVHSDTSTDSDAEPSVEPHTYRFLQIFDAHMQELRTVGSFIARKDAAIKDTVRTILGYPADKSFQMWYLDAPYRTKSIASDAKFEDTEPRHDSSVILVGDVLSDTEKSTLHDAGKFSSPRSMLNNHWLHWRGHPSANYTGNLEITTFGRHYYKGFMLHGRFHGEGIHINNTGHQYTGTFIQDQRSGQGKLISPNGDVYEGGFKKNERHGEGTFVEKRTGNKYVGGFKEDKRSGKGVTYWEVAQEDEQLCQICYGEAQDALFYDCGHVCACLECARQVDTCPICRKVVKGVVRIFWT